MSGSVPFSNVAVIDTEPRLDDEERHDKLLEAAHRYAISSRNLRADEDESVAVLREAWSTVRPAVADGTDSNGDREDES